MVYSIFYKKIFAILLLFFMFALFFYLIPTFLNYSDEGYDTEEKIYLQEIKFKESSVSFVKIDKSNIDSIKFYYKDENDNNIEKIEQLRIYLQNQNKKLIFAMNGGIFSENYQPLGLYIENGKEISRINLNDGQGNFFLKPNGIFQITGNKAKIFNSVNYIKNKDIVFAVQSGPILVLNNEINNSFDKKSENKYVRNGVGVNKNGDVFFAISNDPINFYDFSLFFKEKLKCENALYLDGAISEMYFLDKKEKIKKSFATIIGIYLK